MTDATHTTLDSWPEDRTVYLTLDLERDYGTAATSDSFHAARRSDELVRLVESHDVPLTCFVQTRLIDETPAAVSALEDASIPVEFHAHSHTHARQRDVEYEVRESVRRVRDRFGTDPLGYRFPDGAAEAGDREVLAEYGVAFSSSLFPSWRPGRFDNSDRPLHPFRHPASSVWELPFTVYSERLRIPVSLSYLKLLGRPFEWLVHSRPPDVIVFDMHMHDLFVPPAYDALPRFYRAVYGRRMDDGFRILDAFVTRLLERGYEFALVSDLYEAVANGDGTATAGAERTGDTR